MKFSTTLILLVVLVVVGGGLWLFSAHLPEPAEPAAGPPAAPDTTVNLLDPQPDYQKIIRVVVERPDQPRMVFTRAPKPDQPDELDAWQASEPLAVPVQPHIIDTLVTAFTGLRSRSRLPLDQPNGITKAAAGLEPPVATVTLVDNQEREYRIEVGRQAAISNDTYVRLAGEPTVHVTQRDLAPQVKKGFDEYRERKLTTLVADDATRVEIAVAGERYELTRGADGWVLDRPVKAHAVRDEVMNLLRDVAALRAEEFVADAPAELARYGLDEPYLTVNVTTERQRPRPATPPEETDETPAEPEYETVTETVGVAIGAFADMQEKRRYARRLDREWVVSVTQDAVGKLLPDLAKLRDPQITRVRADDVTQLQLSADGLTVTLNKVDGRWQGQGDLAELEVPAVIDILQAFEDLRAIDYILAPADLAEYGLTEPRATLTVSAGGTVAPVTVRVGDLTRSARNAYVQRADQATVFVVAAAQANRLVVSPFSLRSRSIFSASPQAIKQIEVAAPGRQRVLERVDREWQLVEPSNAAVEQVAARTLAGDLARLRARRVAGREDPDRYGLDQPEITVTFRVELQPAEPADEETAEAGPPALVAHTLRVARRDTVAYARFDDDPFIYELDETIYRVLTAELVNRKVFDILPQDIVGMTIITPGSQLELVQADGEWQFAPDPYVTLDQSKVKELADAVAGLRVESYEVLAGGDFQATGLFAAPITVSSKLTNGQLVNLKLEDARPDGAARLAGWVERKSIFRLSEPDCAALLRGLEHYIAADGADRDK
jgi:hypothetical protein